MAILCLSNTLKELRERLGNILVGYTRKNNQPIFARDLNAHGAMATLLKDALKPNLVQTLENNPVFVHGGPFANIAHGCNTVIATKTALKMADYVVTEAGFGADLGAEKFIDIKCRKAGIQPDAVVLVATVRALSSMAALRSNNCSRKICKHWKADSPIWNAICTIFNRSLVCRAWSRLTISPRIPMRKSSCSGKSRSTGL